MLIEKGSVLFYTTGVAEVRVNFPEDDVKCQFCPFCRTEESLKRWWCRLTNELIYNPYDSIGDKCPINFEKGEWLIGIPILILGDSGSGKSTSLRNFEIEDVSIFNVAGKPLPFRKKLASATTHNYEQIKSAMKKSSKKTFVIDDSQYLLAFASFDKAKETGYTKFTDFAVDFKNLITFIIEDLPNDILVYFLHHTETNENGKIKAKTIGKMLDSQLTVEGLFSIVLLAKTESGRYFFETQSDGQTTCKSPMEMFEKEIDNDLKFVDTTIRDYWELNSDNK